jgi:Cys-tRNA(Pro) deacylase
MFEDFLRRESLEDKIKPVETTITARSAEDAAKALNCEINQIVKSLVVSAGGRFYTFLVPGNERLDFSLIPEVLKTIDARMATADEVKRVTGYSIGGIPPFGHKEKLKTYIYPNFPEDKLLYAAAGDPNRVFSITQDDLFRITKAEIWNL